MFSYIHYYGPIALQFILYGMSFVKRDFFLLSYGFLHTWIIYGFMAFLRDTMFASVRPFYVSECTTSYAVPDPWWVSTVSFSLLIILCAVFYRRRTIARMFLLLTYTGAVMMYLISPVVVGYLSMYQFMANVGFMLTTLLITVLFTHYWFINTLAILSHKKWFPFLFNIWFLSEWYNAHPEAECNPEHEKNSTKHNLFGDERKEI